VPRIVRSVQRSIGANPNPNPNVLPLPSPSAQAVAVPMWWTNTPPLSWSLLYLQGLSYLHPGIAILGANSGSSRSQWGAGAYLDGRLVSDLEAWSEPYGGILHVTLPQTLPLPLHRPLPSAQKDYSVHAAAAGTLSANLAQQAVSCEIPYYGAGTCTPLSATAAGHATASIGNATCSVDYAGISTAAGSVAVLVALDVVYGAYETTAPLHILACAVIQCMTTVAVTDAPLVCAAEYGAVNATSITIRADLPLSGDGDDYQVLPLVGRGDGHSLDASHWTYTYTDLDSEAQVQAHAGAGAGARGRVHVLAVEGDFGAATLLAVQQ